MKWSTNNITASFMPDGTPTDTGFLSNLSAHLNQHLRQPQWQGIFHQAMSAWTNACGLEVSWVGGKGNISFYGRTMEDSILAWTYGPPVGEVYLGTHVTYLPVDLSELLSVMLHEIGHAIGLDHNNVPRSVMWPYSIATVLSPEDVHNARALYGAPNIPDPLVPPDKYESNNTPETAKGLGTLAMPYSLPGMTLHSTGDQDWYSFRVPATDNYLVRANFEQIGGVGGTFFMAVFNDSRARLVRTNAVNGNAAVAVRLAAGQRYYLRLLSPSGGLFRYDLAMVRA